MAVGQASRGALLWAPLAREDDSGNSNTSCQQEVMWGSSTSIQNAGLKQVSALGLPKCGFCNGPVLTSVSGKVSAGAETSLCI